MSLGQPLYLITPVQLVLSPVAGFSTSSINVNNNIAGFDSIAFKAIAGALLKHHSLGNLCCTTPHRRLMAGEGQITEVSLSLSKSCPLGAILDVEKSWFPYLRQDLHSHFVSAARHSVPYDLPLNRSSPKVAVQRNHGALKASICHQKTHGPRYGAEHSV